MKNKFLLLLLFCISVVSAQKIYLNQSDIDSLKNIKLYKNCFNHFRLTNYEDSTIVVMYNFDIIRKSTVDFPILTGHFLNLYSERKYAFVKYNGKKINLRFHNIPNPDLSICRSMNKEKLAIIVNFPIDFLMLPSISVSQFRIGMIGKIEIYRSNHLCQTIYDYHFEGIQISDIKSGEEIKVIVYDLYRANPFNQIIKMPIKLKATYIVP